LRSHLPPSGTIWRSLDALDEDAALRESLKDEFPPGACDWDDSVSRRGFLQLMGASLALAGLYGCSDRPAEAIVPYVNQPEALTPGEPLFFATAMPLSGYGRGVLVCSREGRPIKIEGNPDHPASLGATDALMQASILDLYDPNRSKVVTRGGEASSWGVFQQAFKTHIGAPRAAGEIRLLTGAISSPTHLDLIRQFLEAFPNAHWHSYEPLGRYQTRAAFGQRLEPVYRLQDAAVILAVDSDFLWDEPGSVAYARQFSDARRARTARTEMNRLYVMESSFSITGAKADHRLPAAPEMMLGMLRYIAGRVGGAASTEEVATAYRPWLDALASDLRAAAGRSLVIVGESQPPAVHALGYAINQQLGNIGKTIDFIDSPVGAPPEGDGSASLRSLVDALNGQCDTLLIFADDPADTAPADIPLAAALARFSTARRADGTLANFSAHLGRYVNHTSYLCQWHLPESHYLESWGDIRSFDGSAALIQPLIAPLYQTHTAIELLRNLFKAGMGSGHEIVRGFWQEQLGLSGDAFEQWWQQALRAGVIASSAAAPVAAAPAPPTQAAPTTAAAPQGLSVVFRPDYAVWDGSFAMNPWLQELPRPLTKIVWSNAALMSPALAARNNLVNGDMVRLTHEQRAIDVAVMLVPGLPDNVITLHLGYGRLPGIPVVPGDRGRGANPSSRVGFDVYPLRSAEGSGFLGGVTMQRLEQNELLVATRNHHVMSPPSDTPQRKLIRAATLEQFRVEPEFARTEEKKPLLSLYPGWDYSKGLQWGMVIDMTACIGCNTCVVACQAENNIPVVGPQLVSQQREMHWIRIDDYFGGDTDNPTIYHQPVPCMHCENAPCEYVCPVGATTHSSEGLNQMTYNRCVGTRYCSNNCPYKVRRFNFLEYSRPQPESMQLRNNPDVTVRSRGVMEKCTYCVQRINYARRKAEIAVQEILNDAANDPQAQQKAAAIQRDIIQRLQTACQQACPTQAIIFGDINDKQSAVANAKAEPTNYGLLEDLTTRPRTTYLAHLSNPNPALMPPKAGEA
jgi:molybdopterin-containing oxidoreductase family iron-sulfur binding subunit